MFFLFYTIKKQTTTAFLFQNLSQLLESWPVLCPLRRTRKKPFDVICCLYKMKRSHWLLCVAKNCDWSRKITPLSNLTQRASREMKTYSESRIELRNLQILKKIPKKSVFVIRTALWAEKVGCCLEYCRSWKDTLGKLTVEVNTGGHLIRVYENANETQRKEGGCILIASVLLFSSF